MKDISNLNLHSGTKMYSHHLPNGDEREYHMDRETRTFMILDSWWVLDGNDGDVMPAFEVRAVFNKVSDLMESPYYNDICTKN